MKKTKIICTMGPNIGNKNAMMELIRNGMDVARFNFSHGDYNERQGCLGLSKEVRKELDIPITVLLDTKGSKIRAEQLRDGEKATLKEGQTYTLTTRGLVGDDTAGYINYSGLNEDVAAGNQILIDDELIELEVREVRDTDIVCEVINGGELGERKGVNVPNVKIKLPALADKDEEDIRLGIRWGFNFIVASFVRTTDCTEEIKAVPDGQDSGMEVTAKTKNAKDTENLDTITEVADGIMVIRSDIDVEISVERVPHIQKKITRKCNEACKIVAIATQILDFVIRDPRPAKAEVANTVNVVYGGTDTVMLSGEAATGKHPMDALKMIVSIALETKMHLDYAGYRQRKVAGQNMKNASDTTCPVSVSTTHDLGADVTIASSTTGFTTQMLSKWRSSARIIDMFPSVAVVHQVQLQWSVASVWSCRAGPTDELIGNSVEEPKDRGPAEEGGLAVITAGAVAHARHHEIAIQIDIMRVINTE